MDLGGLVVWLCLLPRLLRGALGALDTVLLGLGGLLISSFSCVLLAELAVGRIILAKKDSSGAREAALLLARECGLSCDVLGLGASETREPCLRTELEDVVLEGFLGFSAFSETGLRLGLVEFAALVRLGGRDDGREVVPPVPPELSLAADEAVGAIIEFGRRTGRVGDLVCGLLSARCLAPGFSEASFEDEVWGFTDGFAVGFTDVRPDCLVVTLAVFCWALSGSLEAFAAAGLRAAFSAVVGVFGGYTLDGFWSFAVAAFDGGLAAVVSLLVETFDGATDGFAVEVVVVFLGCETSFDLLSACGVGE